MDIAIDVRKVSKSFYIYKNDVSSLRKLFLRTLNRSSFNIRQPHFSLEDISISIGYGETLALIGPNGAGKSTLLRLMAGIYWPTKGEVVRRGSVAAVIELTAGFHPELTGFENVFLYGSVLGLRRNVLIKRYKQIVEFAGLEEFVDTPLKYYSTGMRMRLGFSVATCVQPDILLLDEVFAVGDAEFRDRCINRLLKFQYSGCTIVIATHDLDMAHQFATKAAWIDDGCIRLHDAADEVIAAYKNCF